VENNLLHYIYEKSLLEDQDNFIYFMDRKRKYTKYSYADIWNEGLKYASFFKEKGIQEGEVVSVILQTSIEFIGTFLGIQMIGATPVSLYPPMGLSAMQEWLENTKEMINSVDSRYVITEKKIKTFIEDKGANFTIIDSKKASRHLKKLQINLNNFQDSDLCFLQFSSGTTMAPSPVMISHRNAVLNAKAILNSLDLQEDLVTVSWLPMYHDMGLVGALITSIVSGGKLILINSKDFIRKPQLWFQAISDHCANATVAPNFAYGLSVKRVTDKMMEGVTLSSLKYSLCGAEVIYKETMEKFIHKFSPYGLQEKALTPVYGMAEATLAVTFSSFDSPIKWIQVDEKKLRQKEIVESKKGIYICSVGKPIQQVSVFIKDSKGEILSEKKVGRIFISGPSVTQGYYKDQKKTEKTLTGSLLDTGDEGFMHQGSLYICGRFKDTIIIRGKNYYPTVLEEAIYKLPEIREGRVSVSSIANAQKDTEELVIFAELKSESLLKDSQVIQQKIKEIVGLKSSLVPLFIELLSPGTLPKTSSGKIKRRQTVIQWQNNELHKKIKLNFFEKIKLFIKTYQAMS